MHSVTLTLDVEGHTAMKQTVEHRYGHHVVIEDLPQVHISEVFGHVRHEHRRRNYAGDSSSSGAVKEMEV